MSSFSKFIRRARTAVPALVILLLVLQGGIGAPLAVPLSASSGPHLYITGLDSPTEDDDSGSSGCVSASDDDDAVSTTTDDDDGGSGNPSQDDDDGGATTVDDDDSGGGTAIIDDDDDGSPEIDDDDGGQSSCNDSDDDGGFPGGDPCIADGGIFADDDDDGGVGAGSATSDDDDDGSTAHTDDDDGGSGNQRVEDDDGSASTVDDDDGGSFSPGDDDDDGSSSVDDDDGGHQSPADDDDDGGKLGLCTTIGNFVWNDLDEDGIQDDNEPGIAGVIVELYNSVGSFLQRTTTNAAGLYLFSTVAGNYQVKFILPPGYRFTTKGAGTSTGRDSDADGSTGITDIAALATNQNRDDIDAGLVADALLTINKTLNGISPIRNGMPISFTIAITNTGSITITTLPLKDVYDRSFITFTGSTPQSENQTDDGMIEWNDLTQSGSKGVGVDLAPGQGITIIVDFQTRADTTALFAQSPCTSDGYTCNVATVSGAKYDPDGPGTVPEQGPLPDSQAADDVQIVVPTGVSGVDASVSGMVNGIALSWQTINEADIAGFNVVRTDLAGRQQLNSNLIPALSSGQATGNSYSFTDSTVVSGADYSYLLQVVGTDGEKSEVALGSIMAHWYLFATHISR